VETSDNLAVIEHFLIAVRFSNRAAVEVVQAEAKVDLAEFELTPQEVQKLRAIVKMLNNELAKSLERSCSAVSITSELRPFETP
jgi:hypothetical protein